MSVPTHSNRSDDAKTADSPWMILVVDDDTGLAKLVQKTLKREGFIVETAHCGKEALQHLREQQNLILLLDQNLPDIPGKDLIETIHAQGMNIPFVAMTGAGSERLAVDMMKLGAKDYLIKGLDLTEILPQVFSRIINELNMEKRLKEMEQTLNESELRFKTFVENATDAFFLLDQQGKIVDVNSAACLSLGYTQDELLDMWFEDIDSVMSADRGIEYLSRVRAGENLTIESMLHCKNGTTFPVESRISAFGENDDVHYLALSRNISDRKAHEAEMELLKSAIEQLSESILITSAQGEIRYINPAFERMSGYRFEDVYGKNPRLLKSGNVKPELYASLWGTITTGRQWSGNLLNRRKDGTVYLEKNLISPIKNSDGQITYFIAIKTDITKESRRENKLQRMQKMESIGQLAGGVAHDFNNILQTISGFCEMMSEDMDPASQQFDDLMEINKAATHAKNLTKQLLSFSREDKIDFQPCNLNEVLGDIDQLLKQTLSENHSLDIKFGSDLLPIYADASQLTQIIINLTVNARDAMVDNGTISIETGNISLTENEVTADDKARPGNFVFLSVKDTGCGIEEKSMTRLFDPFFTTKGLDKGTGLGLSVVYGIAQKHHGWISVESQPHQGATFTVYLPTGTSKQDFLGDTLQNITENDAECILLVEDDIATCDVTMQILEGIGYDVTVAYTAKEAEEILKQNSRKFDLLFSDIILPDGSGIELAALCHKQYPDIRLVLSSGDINAIKQAEQHPDSTAFKMLDKPYNISRIMDVISYPFI